jgi:hypothetical protein
MLACYMELVDHRSRMPRKALRLARSQAGDMGTGVAEADRWGQCGERRRFRGVEAGQVDAVSRDAVAAQCSTAEDVVLDLGADPTEVDEDAVVNNNVSRMFAAAAAAASGNLSERLKGRVTAMKRVGLFFFSRMGVEALASQGPL